MKYPKPPVCGPKIGTSKAPLYLRLIPGGEKSPVVKRKTQEVSSMDQEKSQKEQDSSKVPLPDTTEETSKKEPLPVYDCISIRLAMQYDLEKSLEKSRIFLLMPTKRGRTFSALPHPCIAHSIPCYNLVPNPTLGLRSQCDQGLLSRLDTGACPDCRSTKQALWNRQSAYPPG